MTPEYSYKTEKTERGWYNPVSSLDVWQQTVKIERLWGYTENKDKSRSYYMPCHITRTYENVTISSLNRLHKAVCKLVNDRKANIYLGQVGKYGISYEVKF